MAVRIITQGKTMLLPLTIWLAGVQARLDDMMIRADTGEAKAGKLPVWAMILIGVGVVICLCFICMFLVPMLLGPSIGNVFSNIIEEME